MRHEDRDQVALERELLFSLETDSLKLCLEAAVRGGADLGGAYLGGAYLRGADLRGADLGGADLGGAKMKGPQDEDLVLTSERPILQLGPLGSRTDYLIAYFTDQGVFVRAGCFFNTLEHFRAAVAEQHGDNVHGQEYQLAIGLIELHAAKWPAPPPAAEPPKEVAS